MINKIKAVIFDMDGVLVDAKEWHYEALNRALNLYGYNISREDHLSTYDGLPTRVKLKMLTTHFGLPESLHSVINNLKQMYTQDLIEAYCVPTSYHIEALKKLKSQGYKLAVASNSVRKSVELMMRKTQLDVYLDLMLSNEDVQHPKPHPDIYLKAMRSLKVLPNETLVLEDNPHGIQAAEASGACLLKVKEVSDVNYNNILDYIRFYEKNVKQLEPAL